MLECGRNFEGGNIVSVFTNNPIFDLLKMPASPSFPYEPKSITTNLQLASIIARSTIEKNPLKLKYKLPDLEGATILTCLPSMAATKLGKSQRFLKSSAFWFQFIWSGEGRKIGTSCFCIAAKTLGTNVLIAEGEMS